MHISCQDGEITFDSSILLHNKLSSCTSATLGSQFAGGIKYEVLNSVLFSLQSYLWKHKNWVTNVKIQSAYLQISGIFKSESYHWVCLGKEHQNNLPVLAPFSFENCGLRCQSIVDTFHRKLPWSILGGTWVDNWGRSLHRQDFVSMSWISLTLLSSFNLSMRVSRLGFFQVL